MGFIKDNVSLNYCFKVLFEKVYNIEGLTEIAINRPNEIWVEANNAWQKFEDENITYKACENFCIALASNIQDDFSELKPILSAMLTTGDRVQCVGYSACEPNTFSITLRKPNSRRISLAEYSESGFFDEALFDEQLFSKEDLTLIDYLENQNLKKFFEYAPIFGKTIVIAGETGSGKTTFMKTLVDFIPPEERIITIEDSKELDLVNQHNRVHLFYPSEISDDNLVTPSSLLKSCLRMKPDRILLTELRGGETYDFINILSSGHGGSITSCHAGSVIETFDRLALMTLKNAEGKQLSYEVIHNLLRQTIDIVVQIKTTPKRKISEIYFNKYKLFKEGKK